MTASRDLLVEVLVEELPPKALERLSAAFAVELTDGLIKRHLKSPVHDGHPYATPRRIAALIPEVAERAEDRVEEVKVMPVSVGLADGRPTPALLKRLAALGLDESAVPSLSRRTEGKAEVLFLKRTVRGQTLTEGLQDALAEALARLPIPKVMQYQLADGWTTVSFVRPAHALIALHGDTVVRVHALGLEAGRATLGHRFEAKLAPILVRDASSYEQQLLDEGAVIASFAGRRAEIARQLHAAAASAGLLTTEDALLLDEVTALVERPKVLACSFEAEFLTVPPECLILTMKANQKYFPLLDAKGALTKHFLVVSNIAPTDTSRIVEGNERVIRPRLADAKFFFDQDRKKRLESRVPGLDKVVYHAKLGSQGERVQRVRAIAGWVAERIGASVDDASRAAELSKADLLTDMVGEFPELQGIMGGYYAAHDGENEDVVKAIRSQYINPRGEVDEAPNLVAVSLLIADRAETLVGIWGIGLKPTGEKDPYALRRNALTLLHAFSLLTFASGAAALRLSLSELLEFTRSTFDMPLSDGTVGEVTDFIYERLGNQLAMRFDVRTVGAVMALHPSLQEVEPRLEAVVAFQQLPEATALAAANKRVGNILKKSGEGTAGGVDPAFLREPAEAALHDALVEVGPRSAAAFELRNYAASLQALASLRSPVDAFFDTVMVNVDDPALRANRLALLAALHAAMNRVADLSRLAG